jgi:transposase-like protein
MEKEQKRHSFSHSEPVREIPRACSDELAAVEFLEKQRWGDTPACVKCESVKVYKMVDANTGGRNKRYLWRCHDCKEQYTVRIGTVYEESRIPLRHWCYAFWRACTSKKGVSALEITRQCEISYKSALFLMNRIRFAMAPDFETAPKLSGLVECDETYVGGKPRFGRKGRVGRGTRKTPVFAAIERYGQIRRRIVPDVSGKTLKAAVRELVAKKSRIVTDDFGSYKGIANEFEGGHRSVARGKREYARGYVHTNTAESSFAITKRGITGIYHNVSKEHLNRYLWQFDFLWNNRKLKDGERTVAAMRQAEGKRLMYKQPVSI